MFTKDYFLLQNEQYRILQNSFYFDIETTGLSPKHDCIILICAAFYFSDREILVRQYFAEDASDEKILILSFLNDIRSMNECINFNGNTFDLPFIKKRMNHLSVESSIICNIKSVDILSYLKPLKKLWNFENLKLKTVEKFFSIERKDTISGKDSADMYRLYQRTRDSDLKDSILLHNYEDVKHLILLENKIHSEAEKRSKQIHSPYGNFYIYIYDYKIDKNKIVFIFSSYSFIPSMNIFKDNGDSLISYESNLKMTLMIMKGVSNNKEILYLEIYEKNIPVFIDKVLFEDGVFYALNSFFNA